MREENVVSQPRRGCPRASPVSSSGRHPLMWLPLSPLRSLVWSLHDLLRPLRTVQNCLDLAFSLSLVPLNKEDHATSLPNGEGYSYWETCVGPSRTSSLSMHDRHTERGQCSREWARAHSVLWPTANDSHQIPILTDACLHWATVKLTQGSLHWF